MNRRRHFTATIVCAFLALGTRSAWAQSDAEGEAEKPAKPAAKLPPDDLEAAGYIPGYRRAIGLGLSPQAPVGPALPGGTTVPYSAPDEESEWKFNFRGYMSASFRATQNTLSAYSLVEF